MGEFRTGEDLLFTSVQDDRHDRQSQWKGRGTRDRAPEQGRHFAEKRRDLQRLS
jgi:hypothetical protein